MNYIALVLRVAILYPVCGAAAAWFSFVDFDKVTGLAVIDVNAVSVTLALTISGGGSGLTFLWSRLSKARGGEV